MFSPRDIGGILASNGETLSKQDAHAEKVQILASALVARYGKGVSTFVAQQVVESDEANRPTWLTVMEALPR